MPIQTASQALGNESSGSPFGFKNRIINGAMVFDQRNAGGSVSISSATNTYFIDRWRANAAGGGVFSVQRSTVAPAGFTNSILATVTTADSSVGSGDFYHIRQSIEGFNFSDMGFGTVNAQTVTISFWVRSSVTGNYSVLLRNEAGNRGYLASYTINSANTFEYKTVTITGDTSGTWSTDNTSAAILSFNIGTGATQSLNTWGSSVNEGFTGQTQWISTNGATFYITGVQLEKGVSTTSFDYRPYGTELAMCQRYYQKSFAPSTVPANNTDSSRAIYAIGGRMRVADVTGLRTGQISFPCTMRTTPTLAFYNSQAASGTAQLFLQNGTTQDSTTAGPVNTSEIGFSLWQYTGVTIGSEGNLVQAIFHYTAAAEL